MSRSPFLSGMGWGPIPAVLPGSLTILANGITVTGGAVLNGGTTTDFVNVTSATVPVNGMYLSAANTVAWSTNTTVRGNIDNNGVWTINAPSSGNHVFKYTAGSNGFQFTDGTRSINLYGNATDMYFGTSSNHPLNILCNNAVRMTYAVGGGFTIAAPTVTSNPALISNGAAYTPFVNVNFAATGGVINCALSNTFKTAITGNVTGAYTLSNPFDGQTINWQITQDATGSRTMVWPATFTWRNGSAGVLSTAPNAVDILTATYDLAANKWRCDLGKGYA